MKLLLLLFCTLSLSVNAQLETVSISPYWMVSTNFLGPNYDVSNVQYTGAPNSFGQFDASGTNIGLDKGIILTTGTIEDNSNGPHGPNNSSGAGIDNGFPGNSLLSNLILDSTSLLNETYNAAVLEFDFIPESDSVKFKYVFGSEEYPENVGGDVNDVFAFFISGPGFGGVTNMATIPGSNSIISINSVNNGATNTGPCQNCAYYVDNGDGNSAPQDGSSNYIQYDGFTTVIEAVAKVNCGETYHLKIAIADVTDGIN